MPGSKQMDLNQWAQDRLSNGKFDLMTSPILENRDKMLNHRIQEVKSKLDKLPKTVSREEKIACIKSYMRKGYSYNEATDLSKDQPSMKESKLREEWRDLVEALSENNRDRHDLWHFNMPETSDDSD